MLAIRCNSRIKPWKNITYFWKSDKFKLFINKCKWGAINAASEKDDWKNLKKII